MTKGEPWKNHKIYSLCVLTVLTHSPLQYLTVTWIWRSSAQCVCFHARAVHAAAHWSCCNVGVTLLALGSQTALASSPWVIASTMTCPEIMWFSKQPTAIHISSGLVLLSLRFATGWNHKLFVQLYLQHLGTKISCLLSNLEQVFLVTRSTLELKSILSTVFGTF